MKEIIRIKEQQGEQIVSARELYDFLEVGTEFARWCTRMFEYGFIEGVDYSLVKIGERYAHNKIDYALTMDCAKEISMLQRTEKGKEARRYFIEVEKEARKTVKNLSTLDILEISLKQMREQQNQISEIKDDVLRLKAATQTRPNFFTIAGYGTLHGISVNLQTASYLGRKAAKICKENGIMMDETHDPRFGKVNCYPEEVLHEVFTANLN